MDRSPVALLDAWLRERLSPADSAWLGERIDEAVAGATSSRFFMDFGRVPRRTGRAPLSLPASAVAEAERVRSGWRPGRWTVDQAARTRLLLAVPTSDGAVLYNRIATLLEDAGLEEAVAIYQSLPLLPHAERYRDLTIDGVRTNIKPVFEAIALDNPYPAEQLDDAAFNQIVLKCLFVGSPLYRVAGLERRSNPELARMLHDYAHERWAAGRPVPVELWLAVGRHARGPLLDDLRRVLRTGSRPEQLAAALASRSSPDALPLESEFPEIFDRVAADAPSWRALAEEQQNQ